MAFWKANYWLCFSGLGLDGHITNEHKRISAVRGHEATNKRMHYGLTDHHEIGIEASNFEFIDLLYLDLDT